MGFLLGFSFIILTISVSGFVSYREFRNSSGITSAEFVKEHQAARTDTPDQHSFMVPGIDSDPVLREVSVSVVNILCDTWFGATGGSGTIINAEGLILTNNHVIPRTITGNPVTSCLVTLPDPDTGKVAEVYVGYPIIKPELSEQYDLAYIKIYAPYKDESGVFYGTENREFRPLSTEQCVGKNLTLGMPISILGYPGISGGGSYLTVTTGVVSALTNESTIVTSAKIGHGNSGGLAIDGDGCRVGVPSKVAVDQSESLGIIYSNELIDQFMKDEPLEK